ncbi:M4 family metallopeptidase [Staphylococcus haemolyticus]|uniref:M4 family metallopeptidase n=1 Tax=Staphylococcus haemolyticus TaxID=1283 RepID=UPI001C1EC065|nr:M4 family metallopeptidase [Staphylococcus haemolyticus]MBU6949657.1 M4 family metallopeptidase [Staphylococcus haemolyticus]MBU7213455.1 M4 family metallopeptidase [Staphylococcus haemolyticus]
MSSYKKFKFFTFIFIALLFSFNFENNSIVMANEKQKSNPEITEGTLKDMNGNISKSNILKQNDKYYLYKVQNQTVIQIFDSNNSLVSNTDNNFTKDSYSKYVSLFKNLSDINQFYKQRFNRIGSIGLTQRDISFINAAVNDATPNAVWTGSSLAVNSKYINISDVLAHEYTHGIIQNEVGKFHFSGETGALEESLSDVFATMFDGNYTIGEKLGENNIIRSLSNPQKYNQPNHMNGYVKTQNDKGGVHINNGIPNYAYYLTVQSIGERKAQNLYYYNLTKNFDENDNFSSFKSDLVNSTQKLYGNNDAQKVREVWNKVGVK